VNPEITVTIPELDDAAIDAVVEFLAAFVERELEREQASGEAA
jgi:hypothetical protein